MLQRIMSVPGVSPLLRSRAPTAVGTRDPQEHDRARWDRFRQRWPEDMSRTHRKTPKGLTEIETRARGLPARMRSVLIMVDGRRPDQEIISLLGPSTADLLVELAWQNYVERIDTGSVTDTRPMPTLQRPDSLWLASQPPLPPVDGADFIDLRERASRRLTDQLGPLAQALAQRMDATETPRDLEPLLDKAAQLLTHSLGADAATRYRSELHKR